MKTLRELLTNPTAGSAATDRHRQAEQVLAKTANAEMRWYLAALTAVGAWLASFCLLAFFLDTLNLWKNPEECAWFGMALLTGCVVGAWCKPGLFLKQCLLATSIAAQALLYWGWMPHTDDAVQTAMLISLGLAAALYWLYPHATHRVLTCIAALQMVHLWLIYSGFNGPWAGQPPLDRATLETLLTAYWVLQLTGLAWCWMRVTRWTVAAMPLGYALAISLALTQLTDLVIALMTTHLHDEIHYEPLPQITGLCSAAVLLAVLAWTAGGVATVRRKPAAVAALFGAIVLMAAVGAGGVLPALTLIVLGFFVEDRLVLGVGLILLPVYVTNFYYTLNIDLLAKSAALIGSGTVLLLLRQALRKWLPTQLQEAS